MHQDDEFEEDEDYYHDDNAKSQYEKFFSIDASIWEKYGSWLKEITDGLKEESKNIWVVYPEYLTTSSKTYYVGQNIHNSPIHKQHIINSQLDIEYRLHIQSHSKHFVQQPHYYNGMFDILN